MTSIRPATARSDRRAGGPDKHLLDALNFVNFRAPNHLANHPANRL